ncbi:hypothetical protein SAICODRAFT_5552 [Saitoella complicata NRRL Y-17804]|uniref:uncharacterized protein n=1 Tax=Saitoella complicata (strain BCRC 22490 / CBS 7301 / JCM 7358 / NBRC 10748 / NRRL Y-17804) TaxID=698492 RepID=UPI0008669DF7|nr:uncharacterized protein SAICODRAFT_5552 [Saitoella complicata NRRL Y-17804]ODQ54929.1 hypothetical protein SAICODRAFT_5552 [Saitoella complicata NRRL Y-17804]
MSDPPSHPIRIGRGGAGNIFRTPPTPPSSYPPSATSTSPKHIHPQIVDVKTGRRNSAPLGSLPSGRRASTGRGGAGNFRKDGVIVREVVEEEPPASRAPTSSVPVSSARERQRRGSRGGAGNYVKVKVDEGKERSSSIAMWELEGEGRRWSIVSSPNHSKERRHTHHGPKKEEKDGKEEGRKSRKGSMAGFWEYLKHGKNRSRVTSTSVPSPPDSPELMLQKAARPQKSKPEKRRTFSEPGEAARLFNGYSLQTTFTTSPTRPGILRGASSGVGYGELAPDEQLPTVLEEDAPVSELVREAGS